MIGIVKKLVISIMVADVKEEREGESGWAAVVGEGLV